MTKLMRVEACDNKPRQQQMKHATINQDNNTCHVAKLHNSSEWLQKGVALNEYTDKSHIAQGQNSSQWQMNATATKPSFIDTWGSLVAHMQSHSFESHSKRTELVTVANECDCNKTLFYRYMGLSCCTHAVAFI